MAFFQVDGRDLIAFPADVDFSSHLYKCATLNSDGEAVLAGAGTKVVGIVFEVAAAGKPVTLQWAGIAKVLAAGAISMGARVQSDSSGLATPGSTNPIGVALTKATAANQVISVALIA